MPTFKFKGRLEKIVSNIERDGLYTTNYSSQNDGWKELEEILFLEPENADAWLCMALRNYYNQSFYSYLQKALQLGPKEA